MTSLVVAHFVDQGIDEEKIERTYKTFPILVSHDTAEFDVTVVMEDGTLYPATVSTRVRFVEPMQVFIVDDVIEIGGM